MNKLITLLCISWLTLPAFPQGKFTVPLLTDLQKYQNAALQLNASYLIQIYFAKSLGRTVEEVAIFFGDQVKSTWNPTGGYKGFVQGMLYTMVSLVPYGSVEITEQTENGLVFKVTGLYTELKEGGSIYHVTWEEYIKFLETAYSRVADYIGAKYSLKVTDEGLIVTIRKQ